MVVMVISRIQQAFARSAFYSNVVGDSMLARLRNSTIALLGVVTVVGLGLVAFISQLGLPSVFNGAIPDGPGGPVAVHGAIALTQKAKVGPQELRLRGHRVSTRIRSSPLGRSGPAAGADLGSSKQAGHGLAGQPPPVGPHPPSTPAPEPTGEPETAPPTPTTGSAGSPEPDTPAQPKEQSSAKSNRKSKGHSREKAKGHSPDKSKGQASAKPDASSTGGSKKRKPEKTKRHSGASPKPGGDSPGKSGESESPSPKPTSAPPSAKPSEKEPPEAGGKDTWDAGKSDRSHH